MSETPYSDANDAEKENGKVVGPCESGNFRLKLSKTEKSPVEIY